MKNEKKELLKKAAAGDAETMYLLAQDYENKGNFDNAFFWYNKAAIQGLADGSNNVAIYYLEGKDCPQDSEKGMELLRQSAASGEGLAASTIGKIYLDGLCGFLVDYGKATPWFEKAYALEIYESVELLCDLYEGLYSRKVKNRENIIINNKKVYPDLLVARTFLPDMNPELYTEVEHIDGDMSNNSTRNLRWIKKK
jgi:TPR repeat protein